MTSALHAEGRRFDPGWSHILINFKDDLKIRAFAEKSYEYLKFQIFLFPP